MRDDIQTFSYTAQRAAFLTLVATFGLAFCIEGALYMLLIVVLIQNLTLKLGLLGLFGVLMCFLVFGVMLDPLRTRHELTSTHLRLHYGRRLNVSIARTAIGSARPVHERPNPMQVGSASYQGQRQRIVAVFSEHGQVLLHLKEPLALKVGRRVYMTREILMNVDGRDDFLQALGLPEVSSPSTQVREPPVEIVCEDGQVVASKIASTSVPVPDDQPAIYIENLTRRFGSFTAVDHLHMSIRRGEIYGFLGSNGAGKTTTLKMLVGLLKPDGGRIELMGLGMWGEPLAAKGVLGYVADRSILYERLSGREFLAFLGQVRGLARAEVEERMAELLDLLELSEQADRLCGSYSFGMKRKLSLAAALLHRPQVLLLDEPLNGLDPRSARRLKDLFLSLANEGTTIMFSTHDLATAEALCHRVGIIHKGRLLAEGSASKLRQLACAPDLEAVFLQLTEGGSGETEQEVLV